MKKSSYFKIIFVCLFFISSLFFTDFLYAKSNDDPQSLSWAYQDVKLPQAWEYTTGSSDVTVAIIDNGFDYLHPDLRENVWINSDEVPGDNIDNDNNGYKDDIYGWDFSQNSNKSNSPGPNLSNFKQANRKTFHHGTAVAGLMGAEGNNGISSSGASWSVKLMNLRVVGSSGKGNIAPLPEAIRYAVDNGADIISFSMVGTTPNKKVVGKIKKAVDYAYNNQVAMFAAAGNKFKNLNKDPVYPICADKDSAHQKIIGVSAVGKEHRISMFSNSGSDCVDVTAPGESVSSTMVYQPDRDLDQKYGGSWSGTSFATPLVAGVGALIKTLRPNWAPPRIYDAITNNTHKSDKNDKQLYENLFGDGLLNAEKAVKSSVEGSNTTVSARGISAVDTDFQLVSSTNASTYDFDKLSFKQSRVQSVSMVKTEPQFDYLVVSESADSTKINLIGGQKNSSFDINRKGKILAKAGDIDNDLQTEVVVVPVDTSKKTLEVYSIEGNKEKEYNLKQGDIESLAVLKRGGRTNLMALLSKEEGLKVVRFNQDLQITKDHDVGAIKSGGVLATGDLDGDKIQEYVVGSVSDNGLVSYYETDGTLQKTIFAYGYLEDGFNIQIADTNGDGEEEVITAPLSLDEEVKIWKDYQISDRWHINKKVDNNLFIIPLI